MTNNYNPDNDNLPVIPSHRIERHVNSYPVVPYPYATQGTEILYPPEMPEAIIARRIPRRTARLLEKESERKHYNAGLAIGANVVNNLVSRLSDKERERIREIEVSPNHVIEKGFLGFGKKFAMLIKIRK